MQYDWADRFFYKVGTRVIGPVSLVVPVDQFWTDTGANADSLPDLTADNSYFNVYVNGVLQMEGLSTYTAGGAGVGQLEVTVPAGSDIKKDSPVGFKSSEFCT